MTYQSPKNKKCDFCFSSIFNEIKLIKNGDTSLCHGTSDLIRGSLIKSPVMPHSDAASSQNTCPIVTLDLLDSRPRGNDSSAMESEIPYTVRFGSWPGDRCRFKSVEESPGSTGQGAR